MKRVLYVYDYHEPGIREIVLKIKNGDERLIKSAALEMEGYVPNNCILIPVPGHLGYPKSTKDIALLLHNLTGCKVMDIIRGNERPSWCFLKKHGLYLTVEEFGFKIMERVTEPIMLIDDVYATGTTYRALLRILPSSTRILVFSIDKTKNNE